jgi:hypothetical protein
LQSPMLASHRQAPLPSGRPLASLYGGGCRGAGKASGRIQGHG